jgi:hypothetical protein
VHPPVGGAVVALTAGDVTESATVQADMQWSKTSATPCLATAVHRYVFMYSCCLFTSYFWGASHHPRSLHRFEYCSCEAVVHCLCYRFLIIMMPVSRAHFWNRDRSYSAVALLVEASLIRPPNPHMSAPKAVVCLRWAHTFVPRL